jgi:hypothetical protein
LSDLSQLHLLREDHSAALDAAERSFEIGLRGGWPFSMMLASTDAAAALIGLGRYGEALSALEAAEDVAGGEVSFARDFVLTILAYRTIAAFELGMLELARLSFERFTQLSNRLPVEAQLDANPHTSATAKRVHEIGRMLG